MVAGEFIQEGSVMRRSADVVVIKSKQGRPKDWPIKFIGKRQPKKYFRSGKEIDYWKRLRRPFASDAVLQTNDSYWESISTLYKKIPLPREKRSLAVGQ